MSVATLNNIRLNIGRFGIPTLLVLGNVGNLFIVLIFGRTLKQRINSCALYLLFASIANWLAIDTALISAYYGVDHIESIHKSNVLCKLRWYGGHVLFVGSRNFMIAACVDRWALGSRNTKIRSICRPEIARHIAVFIIVITLLLPVPLFIFFNNSTGECIIDPSYNLAYTIFALISIGILPPLLMILFTFLARNNLRNIRSRVRPISGTGQEIDIHKRDHDFMRMLVGEVLVFCLTTCPYPFNTMYNYLTLPMKAYKDPSRLAIESLVGFIIHPLLTYTYCCAQFYVYAFFSQKFRKDFLALFHRGTQVGSMVTTADYVTAYMGKTLRRLTTELSAHQT